MAEKIAVGVQKGYNGEMNQLETDFKTGKGLIDNRYAEKRKEGHKKSMGALKDAYGHVKTAGNYLWETGKATAEGIGAVIVGTFITVGAPIVGTLVAGYETVFKGGYDTLKSAAIATDASVTTRVNAMSEKSDLKTAHKTKKVATTEKYAGIAQGKIDGLNGELAPFEAEEEALRAELAAVAAKKAPIIDEKTDVVAERKALENKAESMKRWYNNIF